jgi:hypothetical protein
VTWVTVLGQGVILAVAVLGFLSTRRGVTKVHKLVNNQLDRQLTYNQQLAATLTKAGVPVPPQDEPAELPPAGGEEPGVGARREVTHGALGAVDLVEVLVLRGAEAHLAAVGAFQPAGPRGVAADAAGPVALDAVDEG